MCKNDVVNPISKPSEGRCHGNCVIEGVEKGPVVDGTETLVSDSMGV